MATEKNNVVDLHARAIERESDHELKLRLVELRCAGEANSRRYRQVSEVLQRRQRPRPNIVDDDRR